MMNSLTETYFTTILADDEPSIINGLRGSDIWDRLRIKVIATAQNGNDALEQILSLKPDFAVLDIKMPEKSGIDVLKEAGAAGCHTQIIILSGYDEFNYAKDAIKYGAKAYLLKPLDYDELEEELRILCLRKENAMAAVKNAEMRTSQPPRSFFNDLIEGRIIDQLAIQRVLSASKLSISDTPCYILIMSFPEQEHHIPFEQISQVLANRFQTTRHKIWNHDPHNLIAIFNADGETPFERAAACLSVLKENGLPLPKIAIGDTIPGLFQCSYSYNRALAALSYRFYDEDASIFSYEIICKEPPKMTPQDIDSSQLISNILHRNTDGIKKYVDGFMNELMYVKTPSPNYIYSLCYALELNVKKELAGLLPDNYSATREEDGLTKQDTLKKLKEHLCSFFTGISSYINAVYGYSRAKSILENGIENEDKAIQYAKKYIHDNIHKQIKIEDIARQVNLSPTYFAIFFKNKTNMNLRDYLLSEKMEYARQKLLEPDSNITEIAYEIGYKDYRSFSRAFKNLYRQTPSAFQSGKKK